MILLDTNILLRLKDVHSLEHLMVKQKLKDLLQNNETLAIAPQILYEFYVVATRPIQQNGLGLNAEETLNEIDLFCEVFDFLPDTQDLYQKWYNLMRQYQINGKKSHDARLVAFMQTYQITQIYTLNPTDFKAFENIILIL
jgi:predicted nucleic acid-binding protein